jgi:Flp pilus assembly protein TadG
MQSRVPGLRSDERGVVLVTVGVILVALLAVAALVLDLGMVRLNRATSQIAADAASTAAALDASEGDGLAACETAISYLELNLPQVTALAGADCLAFPTTCDETTPPASTTGTAGRWVATVTYPVPDGSPLLDPSAIGAGTQAVIADDGSQCERFAVSISSTHRHLFAQIIGATEQTTEVSAVARAENAVGDDVALNLLVLERFECDAITAAGSGGGNGGISVDPVLNPDTGQLDPGYIAVDSDGSVGCGGDGVLDVDGANAFIRADGPAGCPDETGTFTGPGGLLAGEGCGQIRLLAPGTPGCNFPACTSSGTVAPDPAGLSGRVTRAPVDHRYNCKAAYPFPAGWEIDPCPDPPAPHIDSLVSGYGNTGTTPPGFTRWTSTGRSCTVEGPPGTTIVVPPGDWRIDCPTFSVKRNVIFQSGNVIFDGDVVVESTGSLAINSDPSGGVPFAPDSTAAIVYVRDGTIRKAGGASLILHRTVAYFAASSKLTMQGGNGSLVWSAPTTGVFEDLAMWSEATATNDLAGQASLDLEGVFFAPWARITYRGNGAQQQVEAQFISRTLSTTGQGRLVVRPEFDRAVLFPSSPQTRLIR